MNGLALRTSRISRRMGYSCLALALFLASLPLPSFEFIFLKVPGLMPGWAAAWYSLAATCEGIWRLFSGQGELSKDGLGFFIAGGSAISNLVFLVAPFVLRKRPVSRRSLIILLIVVVAGLVLGIAASLCLSGLIGHLLIGYQLWLCAYMALAAAILSAWLEDRAAGVAQ